MNLLPPGFTVDRIVIARGLLSPSDALSSGSINVFQRIFFRRLSLVDDSSGQTLFSETTAVSALATLIPDLATETDSGVSTFMAPTQMAATTSANSNSSVKLDKLISKGARLFFEETFSGNGRTCGTCHPSSNNFTIDPAFIATRPANDPLFVAEFNPAATGTCSFCHGNAGALSAASQNQNRNFNTNVEDVLHPAQAVEPFPIDGGFGQTANPDGTFGDREFNTASAVEAADTGPFFHNNLVNTLEDVVRFYGGPEFNASRGTGGFIFDETQVIQISDFLRGINTLQNIDMAATELREILAMRNNPAQEIATRLQTAFDETQDAIDVLTARAIFPGARARLIAACSRIAQAQQTSNNTQRRPLVQQALNELASARGLVAS